MHYDYSLTVYVILLCLHLCFITVTACFPRLPLLDNGGTGTGARQWQAAILETQFILYPSQYLQAGGASRKNVLLRLNLFWQ